MNAFPLFVEPLSRLLDTLIPDPQARLTAQAQLRETDLRQLELALQADQAQSEVNTAEAASASLFIAGWRPFIGWVCGVSFAYHYMLQPFLAFVFSAAGHAVALPAFDMESMTTVLIGMLGLGGLRTYEKVRTK